MPSMPVWKQVYQKTFLAPPSALQWSVQGEYECHVLLLEPPLRFAQSCVPLDHINTLFLSLPHSATKGGAKHCDDGPVSS